MAFEYHWIKIFGTLKVELVYFYDYAVIVALIGAGRMNSGICGLSIGPILLVASCVKAIAIHIINSEWLDPIVKAIDNMFQLITYFRITASL